MHIINLNIKCKSATGDGTKIVCLNNDYKVRINVEDCGTFTNSPVKKLIVRHGKDYYESDIKSVTEDGDTYLKAELPPIEYVDYVYLGICGKKDDNPKTVPDYTSSAAVFECEQSILCGTAVLKRVEPLTKPLSVSENGTYSAADLAIDGFHTVDVNIPLKTEENRTVHPIFVDGNHTITPTYSTYTMSRVEIVKPDTLIPENIRGGIDIGGVVGSFTVPDYDGTITVVDDPTVDT